MNEYPMPDENSTIDDRVGYETTGEAEEGERSVLLELRELGDRFAAALRAAAGTPEADALKQDLQEGLGYMRREIDRGLQNVRTSTTRTSATPKVDAVRGELANALRAMNRALDKMADQMDRPETGIPAASDADAPPPPPTA